MATDVSLNAYTLPLPNQYVVAVGYRVAHHVGLDAMVAVDTRANATLTYRDVTIGWNDITVSEMRTIRSAWQDLAEQGQVAFIDPLGVSRTAQIMPGGKQFDSVGYVGQRNGSNMFEALFQVSFQMRLTP